MHNYLEKLLSISSQSLLPGKPYIEHRYTALLGGLNDEIYKVLNIRNGFYAFESALHFFSATEESHKETIDINEWNRDDLWKKEYGDLADSLFCFAEDLFGCQFCIKDGEIYLFDPETGELEQIANDFEGWARVILNDCDFMTGFPLAHEWQVKHNKIPDGKRLIPKKLFVLGGDFSIDNLYLSDAVQGMKYRADIASQIRNLPDGTESKLTVE